jgi:hypothetical protein
MANDHAFEIESIAGMRRAPSDGRFFIAEFDFVSSRLAKKSHGLSMRRNPTDCLRAESMKIRRLTACADSEKFFEDDSLWGSHLRRHPAGDAAHLHRLLKSFETEGSPISLAHADRIAQRLRREPAHKYPATFIMPDQFGSKYGWEGRRWSASIFDIPAQADEEMFSRRLSALRGRDYERHS